MPRQLYQEIGYKYWRTTMMYSNKTIDVVDKGWRNGLGSIWNLYNEIVHQYARPIDIFGDEFSESSHYASRNVIDSNYLRLSPIHLLSHDLL
jgi:hypothetical protein